MGVVTCDLPLVTDSKMLVQESMQVPVHGTLIELKCDSIRPTGAIINNGISIEV